MFCPVGPAPTAPLSLPIQVLWNPVALASSALYPTAVLPAPKVWFCANKASVPIAVFLDPLVSAINALYPKVVLSLPLVLALPLS